MQLLIVDDSISVRKALERILSTRNFSSVSVGSAEEALETLESTEVKMVIADVIMPGMGGFELCQEIKTSQAYDHLPVLLISGIVDQEITDKALAAGATGIVQKPFTPDDLFPKIERALKQDEHESSATQPEANLETAHSETLLTPEDDLQPARVFEQHLEAFLANPAVSAALITTRSGECVASKGKAPSDEPTVAAYAKTLASIAGVLGAHLGGPKFQRMHLEYEGQSWLLVDLDDETLLLLCLKDQKALGVITYLISKFLIDLESRKSPA